MNRMLIVALLALGAGIVSPLAAARAASEASTDARALLKTAAQTRRDAYRASGEEKRKKLEASVAAYHAILESHAADAVACAEAAFRIGEIERSLGDAAGARAAFERTAGLGAAAPRFAARALNELAHLVRRDGDDDAAIAAYQRVIAEHPGEEAEAVKALTWIGKIEAKRGRPDVARQTWLSIPDRFPAEPIAAVRAADLAALLALKDGDAAEARRILEETSRRFSADNREQEWWSPEVEEALGKMKVRARLETEESDSE